MITITKSRFARRSLVLCGLAGAAVIWLMLSLVNLQLVSPRKTSGVSSGGIIEREVLLPQRGASWMPMRKSSPAICRALS